MGNMGIFMNGPYAADDMQLSTHDNALKGQMNAPALDAMSHIPDMLNAPALRAMSQSGEEIIRVGKTIKTTRRIDYIEED